MWRIKFPHPLDASFSGLPMTEITIGRSKDSDIVIADVTVSRRHAVLAVSQDGRMVLTDSGSSAGTHLLRGAGWTRIDSAHVEMKDHVRIGGYEVVVEDLLAMTGKKSSPSGTRKRYERDPETGEIIVRIE